MSTALTAPSVLERTFSLLEADVLVEQLDVETLPYPIQVPSHGVTMAERGVLRRQALDDLTARGLVVDDRPVHALAADLDVLASPAIALDCVYHPGGDAELVNAVVVSRAERAVVAVRLPDGLHLHPCRSTNLAAELVALLPDGPAGTGNGATVDADTMAAAAEAETQGGSRAALQVLADRGVPARDAQRWKQVVSGRLRGGQIGCSHEVPGRRRLNRSEEILSWYDTAEGRFMVVRSGGPRPVLSLVPADAARLTRRVAELLTAP